MDWWLTNLEDDPDSGTSEDSLTYVASDESAEVSDDPDESNYRVKTFVKI